MARDLPGFGNLLFPASYCSIECFGWLAVWLRWDSASIGNGATPSLDLGPTQPRRPEHGKDPFFPGCGQGTGDCLITACDFAPHSMWSCHEESFCIDLSNLASLIVHKLHQLSGLSTYSFTPAAVFSSLASTAIPLSCSIQARQMVALSDVRASNAQISTSLPHGLVAIFIGGTSGIGEYTLKQFARNACQPRIYNIGRSRKASERIEAECLKLNSDVQYTFIQADVSLIKNVDTVCETIRHKEDYVNILFLSAGTLMRGESKEF